VLDILGHANSAVTQKFMGRVSGCDPPRLSKTTLGVGYSLLTVNARATSA